MTISETSFPASGQPTRRHPVCGLGRRLHEVLDEVSGVPRAPDGRSGAVGPSLVDLDLVDVGEALREITSALARLEGLRLHLLARAERLDLAAADGATSRAAWLAHATRTPHREAHALTRLAGTLFDGTHDATAVALMAGEVQRDQAQAIVTAVDALPPSTGTEGRERAEQHLLGEAERFDARRLRQLGRHLLAVVDPDAADEELDRRLRREERQAESRSWFSMYDDGSGLCHGSFRVPSVAGAMLRRALEAIASPARPDPLSRDEPLVDPDGRPILGDGGEPLTLPRTTPALLGQAFVELVERFPADCLPRHGGMNATVLVTMTLESLLGGIEAATLDTGAALSAGEARRIACRAGIIPVVLGGDSAILDAGRKRRLHADEQRVLVALRDRTCRAEGCDRPSGWCHVHHVVPFSQGGATSVDNGTLLCRRHHTLVHLPDRSTEQLADGRLRITRVARPART